MIEPILQRWAQALGGLERIRQVESVYTRLKVETGGLSGTAEEWDTAGGRYRQSLDLAGVYRNLVVFDGTTAWVLDQNGKVRELVGVEREEVISSAYYGSFSHLLPGRMAGQVEHVAQDEAHDIVRLLPQGGRAMTYYLDKATGLPSRYEQREAERIRTTYLDDWREVAGLRWPFHLRQTTGDPQYDTLLAVEEIRLNVAPAADTFARPVEGGPDFRFAAGHSARDIPIELTSNHIYLQLQVNDSAPLWFIFDTGAGASVIDEGQARAQGLELRGKLEGRGAGEGSTDIALVAGACLRLPGVEMLDQTIAAISLEPLTPFEGRAIHGIVGYDLISRFVVEIDYAGRRLHLHDPQDYVYAGPGESIPILLEGNMPHIQALVVTAGREPVQGDFLVDTGARTALVLNKPFVEAHRLEPGRAIVAPFGVGVGGETKQLVGRVAVLQVGRFAIRDVVAGFSQDVGGAGADPDQAGLIGGEVLRRFTAIFDYAHGRMILEPNVLLAEPLEYDMSGLFLAADGPAFARFRVHRVVEDSPAAEAGVQPGDVIVALDGRPPAGLTLEQLREMLKVEGREVVLEVERDGQRLVLSFVLRRLV